jgi:2-alkyl-3-oxoalkanoate reductase
MPAALAIAFNATIERNPAMRIFVAGATGAVGRPLVPALIRAGHSVVGLTRTASKADFIRRMGAEPVVADGLDAAAIRTAVASAKPDVIIHEMTDLTGATDLRHFNRAFAASNRLRTQGTDYLLAAARESGVKRLIAQSYLRLALCPQRRCRQNRSR